MDVRARPPAVKWESHLARRAARRLSEVVYQPDCGGYGCDNVRRCIRSFARDAGGCREDPKVWHSLLRHWRSQWGCGCVIVRTFCQRACRPGDFLAFSQQLTLVCLRPCSTIWSRTVACRNRRASMLELCGIASNLTKRSSRCLMRITTVNRIVNGRIPLSEGRPVHVKFKYVRSYKDRHGRVRVEYRRNGKTIPIHAQPGSVDFQVAYERARARFEIDDKSTTAVDTSPSSLRWLCVEYFKSAEFEQLAPITRKMRRGVLESTLLEPFRAGSLRLFADCPLRSITDEHVKVLRDRKKHAPTAANARIKALHVLFKWGRSKGGLTHNPAQGAEKLKVFGDGHHSWTEQEREQFKTRHLVGSKARLAFALLFHTGQRRSDVVLLGRQHVHNGRLSFTQMKNRRNNPVPVEIPIAQELLHVLAATTTGDLTFLTNEQNKPFTAAQFGDWFRRRCDEAGLSHCSAHGLRKSAATFHADNGCTAHELMAILGWLSLSEAERYTRNADRKRNAERGMARVSIKSGTESV